MRRPGPVEEPRARVPHRPGPRPRRRTSSPPRRTRARSARATARPTSTTRSSSPGCSTPRGLRRRGAPRRDVPPRRRRGHRPRRSSEIQRSASAAEVARLVEAMTEDKDDRALRAPQGAPPRPGRSGGERPSSSMPPTRSPTCATAHAVRERRRRRCVALQCAARRTRAPLGRRRRDDRASHPGSTRTQLRSSSRFDAERRPPRDRRLRPLRGRAAPARRAARHWTRRRTAASAAASSSGSG